jgi:recombination protein RecA
MAKEVVKKEVVEKSGADKFLAEMGAYFGKGSDVLVEDLSAIKVERIPTGSLALDIYLDGGYPKGKMLEAFGMNQSGKSSLCIEMGGKFQELYPDEHVLFVDLEDTFTPEYTSSLGINVNKNFHLMKPKTGEDSFEVLISFAKNLKGGLIILDSVSLLLPIAEDEGDMGKAVMGSQARLMSQGLRKLFPHTSKNGTTVLFINQVRDTFDMYKPVATSGGKAIGFYTRTRLHLSKVKGVDGVSVGCNIKLEKATYGKEGKTVKTARLIKGRFDRLTEIIQIGSEAGVIVRSGAYYKYQDATIGQGIENAKATLEENPDMAEQIEREIREYFNI